MLVPRRLGCLMLFILAIFGPIPARAQPSNEQPLLTLSAESSLAQWEDAPFFGLREGSQGFARMIPLDQLATPTLLRALEELSALHGLVPKSPMALVLLDQKELDVADTWIVELEPTITLSSHLFLFYLPGEDSLYFLQVEQDGETTKSARIWGSGRSELLMSHTGLTIVDGPTEGTVRLQSPDLSVTDKGVADTITCLGRELGLSPTPTALGDLIADSGCQATKVLTLILTTYNCLSIPHPPATIGCVVGVSKLLACGFSNCRPPKGNAKVIWTISDGCVDSRGLSVRIFDRTNGGFYPSGSFYTIPSGGSRKLKFSAPRGSQLCLGAQTSPPTSAYWCVGPNGDRSPNYPGAGTSICCATVPNSGKVVKENLLTCG